MSLNIAGVVPHDLPAGIDLDNLGARAYLVSRVSDQRVSVHESNGRTGKLKYTGHATWKTGGCQARYAAIYVHCSQLRIGGYRRPQGLVIIER